jgi:hypothetical protein
MVLIQIKKKKKKNIKNTSSTHYTHDTNFLLLHITILVHTLVKPLETVLARRQVDSHLRVSALSILSMACQTCPVALSGQMSELIDWVLNILEIEKSPEVRRGKKKK